MNRNGRAGLLVLAIALGCIAVAALTRPGPGAFMDLTSADPEGAKGLRLLVEHNGSTIETADAGVVDAAAAQEFDTVFIPDADGASSEQVAAWRRYVGAGGHLVLGTAVPGIGAEALTDPDALDPSTDPILELSGRNPGTCTLAELADIGQLSGIQAGIKITGSATYLAVGSEDESCFGTSLRALVVSDPGSGVVNIGVSNLFDNQSMGAPPIGTTATDVRANAAVAAALLTPTGPSKVAMVTTGISRIAGDGGTSPFDLLRPGIKAGLWELTIAVGFFAWWQGRRHGRVVHESAPTHLAASELVDAVGNLLQRQGDAANSAEVIRRSVARDLTVRLGMPPAADADAFARQLAERTGRPVDGLRALFDGPVPDDAALHHVAHELESLRHEVLHV